MKNTSILFCLLMVTFCGFSQLKTIQYKDDQQAESKATYTLLPRKGNANNAEWQFAKNVTDRSFRKWNSGGRSRQDVPWVGYRYKPLLFYTEYFYSVSIGK